MLVISTTDDVQYKIAAGTAKGQPPLTRVHVNSSFLHSFCCLSEASMGHAQGHRAETSTTLSRILPIIELSPAFRRFDLKLTCNVVASPKRPVSTPYPYTDLLLHHTQHYYSVSRPVLTSYEAYGNPWREKARTMWELLSLSTFDRIVTQ